ncbi:MAG: hypothetical protein KDM81_22500, partial [Verrucomicrobiae bacterium]|nr:hypothetical protein [Verrucomicrobiae bacterium]
EACEPYPLGKDFIVFSDQHEGRNALFLIRRNEDDSLTRELLFSDPTIDCHSPIPIRVQQLAAVRPAQGDRTQDHGYFLLEDVYQGMPNVPRGTVKKLRVVEETSRVSPTPGSGPFNQTFTISAALAWTAKNYLGEVSIEPDGSAYFEAPAGKMLFFQALDAEGRCVRSMRTFIQAAPGTTRGCIGCHENKQEAFQGKGLAIAQTKPPQQIRDESWGSGVL